MRMLAALGGAVMLVTLATPVAQAGWTRPSVLVTGDGAFLLATLARPDGSLRVAIADTPHGIAFGLVDGNRFADPLVALRSPTLVGQVAFAADGSGVALEFQRGAPSHVLAFDAAGTTQPLLALDDVGSGSALAISPTGAAVAAWVRRAEQGFEVVAAFRDPGSATFAAPVRAGYATSEDTRVSAGIGDSGEAVVAWQENLFPSALAAAVRLSGAGFSPARFVSREAVDAQLAVGPGGQAILATSLGAGLDVSIKAPGADAMPAVKRVDRGQGYSVEVAAAGAAMLAATWLTAPGFRGPARVRVYEGDGRLRRIGTVGRDAGGDVGLAIDGAGAAVVAWEEGLKATRREPTRAHLRVSYRPAGGRLRTPVSFGPVSLDITPEAVQLGPGGRAWVLYQAFQSGGDGVGYRRVYVTERRP